VKKGLTFTLNSADPHSDGKQTYGGYSTSVVVDENLFYVFQEKLRTKRQRHPYFMRWSKPLLVSLNAIGERLKKRDKVGCYGFSDGSRDMGRKVCHALGAHVGYDYDNHPGKRKDA